jgi:hypothetical protein
MSINRRNALATIGSLAIAAPLAGCLGSSSSDDDNDDDDGYQNPNDNGDDNGDDAAQDDNDNGDDAEPETDDDESEADDEAQDDEDDEDLPDPDEVENREAGEDVLEFGDLHIIEYEQEIEEAESEWGRNRMTFTGVVENTDDEKYDSVTVAIRVYDEDGHQLDRHIDITQDVSAGGTWRWEVTPLDDADDIHDYDIAVTGHQYSW